MREAVRFRFSHQFYHCFATVPPSQSGVTRMPSPFPGMDPYLEAPGLFPDLHDRLVGQLSNTLQAALPEPYYTLIGSQIWIESSKRFIEPDVDVMRQSTAESFKSSGAAATSVLTPTRSKPVVIRVPHDERRHKRVEIYARQGKSEQLVTVLEVLSHTNKTKGEQGRGLYIRKQREIVYSDTNLVEIDLLRAGIHTTAAPLDYILERTGPFEYHACVHRYDNLEDYFIYPIRLQDSLPEIAVPLMSDDPPVSLDFQKIFDSCYDAGPYRRLVKYDQDPPVPQLRPADLEWVRGVSRSKGIIKDT